MSSNVTHDDITPPPAPAHRCINASCGCDDLVSAGACGEWCMANTVEVADLERGKAQTTECDCGHATCAANERMAAAGTPERGMA